MGEVSSTLRDQTKSRLNKIKKIKAILSQMFKKEKQWVNTLLLLIILIRFHIVLSAASGRVSIISFASVIGVPARIASASFTILFSLTTGIIKKLLSTTRNKK